MKSLLQLENVGKHYGSQTIFESVSAAFYENQKIGVIGRNGSGKSTLARLITGEEEADSGRIVRTRDLRLSYLEQQDPFHPDETALAFLLRYTGREEWRCGETAARFQIRPEHLASPVSAISGGFQTRLKLAAMLLRDPNFLVLDEPTNYLDLSTLLLLENFLRDFRGGYLIISHDREFLMRTCEQTLDVERGQLVLYPGDIEAYLAFKEEQTTLAEKGNRVIEVKARHLQNFIDRNRARAATATRAQSKMKELERLKRGKISIAHAQRNVRIRLPSVESRSGRAVRCVDLAIGYPDKEVAWNIDFEIERGERIAILGNNGQGKTTLMRTLAGDLVSRGGLCEWANNLRFGYYAQHVYAALGGDRDVFTQLKRCADRHVTDQSILDLAGSFLFQGSDVEKPISVLSGGERARVCLMGLLLGKAPVLLLDEPTNHLDFETVEALGEALKGFDGTLFFISHDRTFVNEVATGILEVKDGAVKRYPGTYEAYVDRLSGDLGVGSSGDPWVAPREGDRSAPREGDRSAPPEGDRSAPPEGDRSAPPEGDRSAPPGGGDEGGETRGVPRAEGTPIGDRSSAEAGPADRGGDGGDRSGEGRDPAGVRDGTHGGSSGAERAASRPGGIADGGRGPVAGDPAAAGGPGGGGGVTIGRPGSLSDNSGRRVAQAFQPVPDRLESLSVPFLRHHRSNCQTDSYPGVSGRHT